jgi:hypothetical protein
MKGEKHVPGAKAPGLLTGAVSGRPKAKALGYQSGPISEATTRANTEILDCEQSRMTVS